MEERVADYYMDDLQEELYADVLEGREAYPDYTFLEKIEEYGWDYDW